MRGSGAEGAEGRREGEEHAAFTKHPPLRRRSTVEREERVGRGREVREGETRGEKGEQGEWREEVSC